MKLQSNGYKILIVDSSLMIVDRLNNLLKEMSCDNCISSANNYDEAVEKLKAERFDIVLLDTQLQGKNGFELLSYIKLNCPDTKTVMITNQTSEFYKMKGKQIGADHFIDKSGEFEKAVEIVREYTSRYQMN